MKIRRPRVMSGLAPRLGLRLMSRLMFWRLGSFGPSWWRLACRLALGASLLLVGFGPRTTQASILLALDLPDLVSQAEHIAVVDVVSVRAAWDDAHQRIYSTVDLKVVESWKGSSTPQQAAGDHLTIVQLGGTVGDISMTVTGLGSFSPGERSLVFLRGPANHAQLVGMTQGKRPLRYLATSHQWMVAPPNLRQAKLVRPAGAAPTATTLPVSAPNASIPLSAASPSPIRSGAAGAVQNGSREMALDDLRAQVQRLLVTTTLP